MKSVNISYLRQHLPEFIAMVAEGVSVNITLRGKPVAQLLPIAPAPDAVATARSRLRGSVLRYDDPLAPVLPSDEWDMNR